MLKTCNYIHNQKPIIMSGKTKTLNDKLAGTFFDYSAWSFYPTKVLLSSEGGISSFSNEEEYEWAKQYANQAKQRDNNIFNAKGYNLRISEFSACLMYAEILHRQQVYEHRKKIRDTYISCGVPLLQTSIDGLDSTCYKYTILCTEEKKNKILQNIKVTGYTQDFLLSYDRDYINALKFSKEHINLPYHREMKIEEANKIGLEVSKILNQI